ncbi:hypothetical protein FTO68_06240 [Methanocalculus taiwanensis]|uniref:Uncharacterized protein n=1 Tax=Methanocalculus taiwanensis TaxID=106207 RepID=A0ABD4TK74_9EURY|nr:hypothetical protein [Methanocalculus taiwanensis]MCQ1538584.1 hypothetical protein [Methanocalculus taiwanensis]
MTDDDLPKNNKDITDDLLDFDISDEEDPIGSPEGSGGAEDRGDHPAIALLDMAISTGADYCKKERLPPPNTAVYDGFSRPFLNSAFWHYFPDGSVPDDPRLGLVAGLAGLALACAPPAMAIYKREEEKKKQKEKKRRDPDEEGDQAEIREERRRAPAPVDPHPGPVPSWMSRLDDMMVPGI